MSQSTRQPRSWRRSTFLLVLALTTTALAVVAGQSLMLGLYRSSLGSPAAAAAHEGPRTGHALIVGIERTPGGPGEWKTYAAVFAQLERDLGRPVRLRYSPDRVALTRRLVDEEVDVALVPVASYIELKEAGEATLVAAPIVASHTHDAAVVVALASSGVHRVEDLRGGRLAVTPGSLAGGAFAYWLLERDGWEPARFCGSVISTGTQEVHLGMLTRGEADATCVNRSDLASWPRGTFRVVAESPEFGMPPLIARRGLGPDTVEAIRNSLLAMPRRGVIPIGSAIGGFSVPRDSDYDFPRALVPYASRMATSGAAGTR